MGEFKSLIEFVNAIKRASEGEVDPRLISNNPPEAYFTGEELLLMEQFANNLFRSKEDVRRKL